MQLSEMVCHAIDYKAMIHAAYFSTGNSANCSFLFDVAIKVEVRVPPALVTVYSCVTQQNFMCKCLRLPWLPCPPFCTIYIECMPKHDIPLLILWTELMSWLI